MSCPHLCSVPASLVASQHALRASLFAPLPNYLKTSSKLRPLIRCRVLQAEGAIVRRGERGLTELMMQQVLLHAAVGLHCVIEDFKRSTRVKSLMEDGG
eukprot:3584808-Pleurochrysis_carterae.AAC.1